MIHHNCPESQYKMNVFLFNQFYTIRAILLTKFNFQLENNIAREVKINIDRILQLKSKVSDGILFDVQNVNREIFKI